MKRVSELLGGARGLADIRPPGRSYADWRRFLDECIDAGAIVVEADQDGTPLRYSGPLSNALARRVGWLADALARGIPYAEAEEAFGAAIDRARALERHSARRFEEARAATIREATDEKRRKRGHPAPEPADWRDEMQTFAEDAGL